MARRKTVNQRQMTRIACRRAGMFNRTGYRQAKKDGIRFASYLFGFLGLVLTLASGFAALPLTIFLMAPAAFYMLGDN
jgi:hypothetical protein